MRINFNLFSIAFFALLAGVSVWGLGWLVFIGFEFPKESGEFGDSFGVVNSLVASLALAGIIVNTIYQHRIYEMQKEELEAARSEQQKLLETSIRQAEMLALQSRLMKADRFESVVAGMGAKMSDMLKEVVVYAQGGKSFNGRQGVIYITEQIVNASGDVAGLLTVIDQRSIDTLRSYSGYESIVGQSIEYFDFACEYILSEIEDEKQRLFYLRQICLQLDHSFLALMFIIHDCRIRAGLGCPRHWSIIMGGGVLNRISESTLNRVYGKRYFLDRVSAHCNASVIP